MHRVAAIQMASGPKVSANLDEASRLLDYAAKQGAKLTVLPESFAFIDKDDTAVLGVREQPGSGPIQDFLAQKSRQLGMWLCAGAVPLACDDETRIRPAYLLYDAEGTLAARYDRIHLFDVTVVGSSTERYHESRVMQAGDEVVVCDTPFGRAGIAASYDLRFPELFRAMVIKGADIILLPASFTAVTGKAHWDPLVRARAVENLCYVVAAAQGGYHSNGRATHGNSMIVDPWGTIIQRLAKGTGVICADIDADRIRGIRRSFPTIEHIRLGFEAP
ncbi:MAG: carbon-nitrogen hydrolase family protein [Gammaproteobacteria bacterium]|nr:carbon-nitrogen hydrolase family protein [Gammaproteobacteria bacterium]